MTSMVPPKLTYIAIICLEFQRHPERVCWASPHTLSVTKTRPHDDVGAELGVRH